MRNAGLDDAQSGIKIARININLIYAEDITLFFFLDTTIMAESKEELKSLLMKVEEASILAWKKSMDRGVWRAEVHGIT